MNKIALVTGATKGIGKAIAVQLAKDGYSVHSVYSVSDMEAESLRQEHGIIFHKVDLSSREQTLAFVREFANQDVHVLVNNAGVWEADSIEDMVYDNWDKTLEVNLTAPLILSAELSRVMPSGASIVNITSTDGLIGAFDGISYSASKAALINITKSLGNSLGPKGIRVNAVAPGWIDTAMVDGAPTQLSQQMTPLGRNGSPEEVAATVSFLVSDKASFINGETVTLDGGLINVDYVLKKESE
jgi:NAD(P)-dependent dehydrogenase (short-subunit alcohol dehydrogenase family)